MSDRDKKLAIVAAVIIVAAGGLWFVRGGKESSPSPAANVQPLAAQSQAEPASEVEPENTRRRGRREVSLSDEPEEPAVVDSADPAGSDENAQAAADRSESRDTRPARRGGRRSSRAEDAASDESSGGEEEEKVERKPRAMGDIGL